MIDITIEYLSITYFVYRLSKKIPSDIAEWTNYMQSKTGAVFFILTAYNDEDGKLSFARFVLLLFLICATHITFLEGMKQMVSVSWPRGKNIGKV